jgi:hypothetical protein
VRFEGALYGEWGRAQLLSVFGLAPRAGAGLIESRGADLERLGGSVRLARAPSRGESSATL